MAAGINICSCVRLSGTAFSIVLVPDVIYTAL